MENGKSESQFRRENYRQLDFGIDKKRVEIEIAYHAGFFDGEGNIDLTPPVENKMPRLRTQVAQKPRLILGLLKSEYGGTIYPTMTKEHKGFLWVLHSKKAAEYLRILLPHLKLKREQAVLAIEYQSLTGKGGGRKVACNVTRRKEIVSIFNKIKE